MHKESPPLTVEAYLALAGWALWGFSLVVPNTDLSLVGAFAFVESVRLGILHLRTFMESGALSGLYGLSLLLGAASNITLFVWVPRWLSIACLFVPWVTFIAIFLESPDHLAAVGMLFIYPWALGITLIHIARLRTIPFPSRRPNANLLREKFTDRAA